MLDLQNFSAETCHTIEPSYSLPPSALPGNRREDFMGIKLLDDGRTEIIHYYRRPDGTATHRKKTIASQKQSDVIKAKMELIEECERCSLKNQEALFEELVDAVLRINDGAGMPWIYSQVRAALKGSVDDKFPKRYMRYVERLESEGKSLNTVSNHKAVIRRVLRHGYNSGVLKEMPIRKFDVEHSFRKRIWNTDEERLRLFNTLEKEKSHIYWACILLERRPIRAVSDLFRLTDDHFVRNNGLPYLRFLAKKTSKKTKENKETHIPLYTLKGEVFEDLVEYFDHGRPQGCRYLFPRLEGEYSGVYDFEAMRKCNWYPMGNPKKHWNTMCKKAEIVNLHIHDLKHIATSNMIEKEGWSIERLLGMGCQFSREMVEEVYWKKNAQSAMQPELNDKQNTIRQFTNII